MYDKKRIKRIIIIAVLLVASIIAFSVFSILRNEKYSATLEIMVAPKKATLTLNGKEYHNGTYQLVPGSYEVSLSADGFEAFSETIELPAHEKTYLYHYLAGPDGDISYYIQDEGEDGELFATIAEYEISLAAKSYVERDKIFTVTPYYDIDKNHFIINASLDEEDNILVKVDLNTCTDLLKPEYIAEANAYLENHGLNLDDYIMTYVGLCD